MKSKWKPIIMVGLSMMTLAGCIKDLDQDISKQQSIGPKQVVAQATENQLSTDNYRAVITDGRYQLGATASIDSNLSSSGNIQAFEEGLLRIAKSVFPTTQYFLQEGQLIKLDTMTNWISRESEKNPDGLNPKVVEADASSTSSESSESSSSDESTSESSDTGNEQVMTNSEATPIYLAQIMEKDIMVETSEGYSLGGIVIGLAMNSEYTYTDANGVVHKQEISLGEMRERGKSYANIIVARLRSTEELRQIPISIGIFRQASSKEVVGGTYVLDGISREGNSVTDWTEHNEERVLLPIVNSNHSVEQYQSFYDFRTQVMNFFPRLNGISAEAHVINGSLVTMNIDIVTQFYSLTEITALTQYVNDVAQRVFPDSLEIQVKIESSVGVEAYVSSQANEATYQSQIFK